MQKKVCIVNKNYKMFIYCYYIVPKDVFFHIIGPHIKLTYFRSILVFTEKQHEELCDNENFKLFSRQTVMCQRMAIRY